MQLHQDLAAAALSYYSLGGYLSRYFASGQFYLPNDARAAGIATAKPARTGPLVRDRPIVKSDQVDPG